MLIGKRQVRVLRLADAGSAISPPAPGDSVPHRPYTVRLIIVLLTLKLDAARVIVVFRLQTFRGYYKCPQRKRNRTILETQEAFVAARVARYVRRPPQSPKIPWKQHQEVLSLRMRPSTST